MISNTSKKTNSIFYSLIICLVLFCSGYIISGKYSLYLYVCFFLILVSFGFLLLKNKVIKFNVDICLLCALFLVILIRTILSLSENVNAYFSIIILALTAYLITEVVDVKMFFKTFLNAMVIICVVSLIGYLLVNTIPTFSLPTVISENGTEYGFGVVFNYIVGLQDRNCGIFWEPGVFASFIIFSIICDRFLCKNKFNFFKYLIFLGALFTTKSAAALVLAFLMFFINLIYISLKKLRLKSIFFVLLSFIIVLTIGINLDTIISNSPLKDNVYINKLLYDNLFNSARVESININLQIIKENFLFGVGIQEYNNIIQQFDSADTATSLAMICMYGIGGIIYTIIIVNNMLRLKNNSKIINILLLVVVLLIVNKEPHTTNLFTWIFILILPKFNEQNNTGYNNLHNL